MEKETKGKSRKWKRVAGEGLEWGKGGIKAWKWEGWESKGKKGIINLMFILLGPTSMWLVMAVWTDIQIIFRSLICVYLKKKLRLFV